MLSASAHKIQKTKGRSKALEDRLRKLESIVVALQLDTDTMEEVASKLQNNVTGSPAPSSAILISNNGFPANVDQPRPELEDVFFVTSAGYLMVPEMDTRKAILESVFLRFVIYALASTCAPPSMVTADFGTKQDMADAYFRRSQSFLKRVFRKPSYHGVLGLMGLVVFCIRTNKVPEAFYYYSIGVKLALSIGLNSEQEYVKQGLSEEEKEVVRKTWWSVYLGDRLLSALCFEPPLIRDEDCKARLPMMHGQRNHPQDGMDLLQSALMSSTDWYVPSPANLSIDAYLLLLVKIHSRINTLSQETKGKKIPKDEFMYREAALASSLRDWYAAIPDVLKNIVNIINGDKPPRDPKVTWKLAFVMILYNSVRISLQKRTLMLNIKNNVTLAATSSAARETFLAGCDVAALIQGFLKHNPSFQYVPPFIASCVFGIGLMLLLITRLNLNPNDVQLTHLNFQTCIACISQHSLLYDIGTSQKALLKKFQTCQEAVLLVLALASLRNLKGDAVPSITGNMLQVDDGSDDYEEPMAVFPPTHPAAFHGFSEPELLERVAQMANPYADLMMGVKVNDEMGLNLFNFDVSK